MKIVIAILCVAGLFFLKISYDRNLLYSKIPQCSAAGAKRDACYRDIVATSVRLLPFRRAQEVFVSIAQDTHQECHDLAHFFGRMTFLKTGRLPSDIDEQSLYLCANGFWHGFMTAYTWAHKDSLQDIVQLCAARPRVNNFELNCFHGVGIGSVGDPPDITMWGNEEAVIAHAIDVCQTIAPTDTMRYECVSGVFHEMVNDKLAGAFGFPHFTVSDPLEFCDRQEKEYVDICIGQMASRLHMFAGEDPTRFMGLLAPHIKNTEFLFKMFSLMVHGFVSSMPGEHISAVFDDCRTLPMEDRVACIKGATAGYLARGVPDEQIDKTYVLCASMEDADRHACNDRLVQFAIGNRLKETVKTLCGRMTKSPGYEKQTYCD